MNKYALWLVPILAIIAGVAIMVSFWDHDHPDKADAEEEPKSAIIPLSSEQIEAAELNLEPAEGRTLHLKTSLPAMIVFNSDRFAHIVTDVTGIAREVRKTLGDFVHAGEVLAILDSRDIADAKAQYLAALRYEELARSTLNREKALSQKKISAEADVLEAEHESDKSTIERQLAEQKLLALGLASEAINALPQTEKTHLRLYELYAPFDGTVVERDIVNGELIQAGSTPYAIANLSFVWVDIGIPPKDVGKVSIGQPLRIIHLASDHQSEARIIYISPTIDNETRTVKVVAELENLNGAWRPGLFVRSEVVTDPIEAAITVPKNALQRIEGSDVVFVQTEEGLEMRPVEIGSADDAYIEILSGLDVGDRCATNNTFVLKSEILKGSGEE